MKHVTLLALINFSIMIFSANAQITITQADFPEIGNLVIKGVDDQSVIDPGPPGTNQTWDFSNLVVSRWDSVYYVVPTGLPGYQNYPEATMAANHNPDPSSTDYEVDYINPTTGGWKVVGYENYFVVFLDYSFAMHIKYIPSSYYLPVPFTYGSSHQQNFVMEWYMTNSGGGVIVDSIKQMSHVNMSMLADASGTMIVPDGSFPVLRVKEVINSQDSVYKWNGGAWVFDTVTNRLYTQYRWYANNYGEIGYYQVDSKKADGFAFFKSEQIVGLVDKTNKPLLHLYPNPANSMIHIESGEKIEKVEIVDLAGSLLLATHNSKAIDVSALLPGMYLVRVYSGNGFTSDKFIKQ